MNHFCSIPLVTIMAFFMVTINVSMLNYAGYAQSPLPNHENVPDTIVIGRILITGNKITKSGIILRELSFREHDTLSRSQFSEMLSLSRQNIFNTRLFNFVSIDTSYLPNRSALDVRISLVERWYIWPIPFFEISDRNFNAWWETRDLSRLTYGIDFTFFNARGRNETLKILTHFGYNQKFGFTYKMPYINTKQTLGTGFGAAVELNHELPVFTQNNKPVYLRNNSTYLKKLFHGFAELNIRPNFFSTHSFRVAYSYYDFDTSVSSIPGYVILDQNVQQFVSFSYFFKNDHRDIQYYPLKGYYLDVELNHSVPYATAYNSFMKTNLRVFRQLYNRWYWASGFTGKLSFEKAQPYYLQRGLGYGRDYVRGYEYYVVDGQHFALLKNNLKFALIPQRVAQLGFIRSTKFNTIPLALYMNAFIDLGYVYHYPVSNSDDPNTGNTLENSLLIGYGLGVDFTTYYDIVVRLEGSVNRMLKAGIYLHFIAPI